MRISLFVLFFTCAVGYASVAFAERPIRTSNGCVFDVIRERLHSPNGWFFDYTGYRSDRRVIVADPRIPRSRLRDVAQRACEPYRPPREYRDKYIVPYYD